MTFPSLHADHGNTVLELKHCEHGERCSAVFLRLVGSDKSICHRHQSKKENQHPSIAVLQFPCAPAY